MKPTDESLRAAWAVLADYPTRVKGSTGEIVTGVARIIDREFVRKTNQKEESQ